MLYYVKRLMLTLLAYAKLIGAITGVLCAFWFSAALVATVVTSPVWLTVVLILYMRG